MLYWLLSDRHATPWLHLASQFNYLFNQLLRCRWRTMLLISGRVVCCFQTCLLAHFTCLLFQNPNWETSCCLTCFHLLGINIDPLHCFTIRRINAALIACNLISSQAKLSLFTLCWFAGLSRLHSHLLSLSFIPDCKQSWKLVQEEKQAVVCPPPKHPL